MTKPVDLGRTNPDCTGRYHGTANAYRRGGCRCAEAIESRKLERRRDVQVRRAGGPEVVAMLADLTAQVAQRKPPADPARQVPACGMVRRLRALAADGWAARHVGQVMGCPAARVQELMACTATIDAGTAALVAACYEAMAGKEGPLEGLAHQSRARGWWPPAEWARWDAELIDEPDPEAEDPESLEVFDEVVVARLMAGKMRPGQTPYLGDRVEAYRRLAERGTSPTMAARIMRTSGDTIKEWQALLEGQAAKIRAQRRAAARERALAQVMVPDDARELDALELVAA